MAEEKEALSLMYTKALAATVAQLDVLREIKKALEPLKAVKDMPKKEKEKASEALVQLHAEHQALVNKALDIRQLATTMSERVEERLKSMQQS